MAAILASGAIARDGAILARRGRRGQGAPALIAVMSCAECAPLSPLLDESAYAAALRKLRVDVLISLEGADVPPKSAALPIEARQRRR